MLHFFPRNALRRGGKPQYGGARERASKYTLLLAGGTTFRPYQRFRLMCVRSRVKREHATRRESEGLCFRATGSFRGESIAAIEEGCTCLPGCESNTQWWHGRGKRKGARESRMRSNISFAQSFHRRVSSISPCEAFEKAMERWKKLCFRRKLSKRPLQHMNAHTNTRAPAFPSWTFTVDTKFHSKRNAKPPPGEIHRTSQPRRAPPRIDPVWVSFWCFPCLLVFF